MSRRDSSDLTMYFRYNWKKPRIIKHAPDKIFLSGNTRRGQRGMVAVLATISLLVLFGFAALAIDVGYLFVVRNELQNAADTAALAGAGHLYKNSPPMPNWTLAQSKATNAISLNKAANATLINGQIQYGYWNITGSPVGLQSTSITPGPNDLPAVKVTISKASGNNGGAVNTFFANVLGIASLDVGATAVAVVSSPGKIGAGVLFPVAISTCMYNNYWDSATQKPKTATSTAPLTGQTLTQTIGQPYRFQITSSYHAGLCEAGQWTSFDVDSNNVPTIRDLITNRNSVPLGIGDNIWIQPGTKTALYSSVNDCSASGNKSCEYVLVPVVDNISTHAWNPIKAFACIHIDLAVGGSGKYIQAEMVAMGDPHCKFPNLSGNGPAYGAWQPPRLANYWGNTY